MTSRITGTAADLLRLPLDKPVGGSGVAQIDVIAVDLTDSDGATGTGFSYCLGGGSNVVLAAAHDLLQNFVGDQPANSPERLWRRMDQSLNRVGRGAHYLAMAAIDVAAWDLHAKRRGEPLGVTMGGSPRTVPVYGSGGYRPNFSPEQARDQALVHVEQGFPAIKPRLAGNASDAARLAAVRDAVPDTVDIMTDANEKCDLASALRLASICADHGCLWLEEPLPARDIDAFKRLAATGKTAIAAGEHLQGITEFQSYVSGAGLHIVQPDLAMAGGLTPSLAAARLAESHGLSVAPHFLPGLFVHLAAAQPNVTWLEDFPLLEPLFDIPAQVADGKITMPDVAGHGLTWADGVRKSFRISP
ncbi:MAG: mandelate racemase/muconate lactonizing enzyme family protein [Rhodospirillales bacterium]